MYTCDCQHKRVALGMQAQAASLRRITQGGLDEASILYAEGLASSFGEAGRRSANPTQHWSHQCLLAFSLTCSADMPNMCMLHKCEHMPARAFGVGWPKHCRVT